MSDDHDGPRSATTPLELAIAELTPISLARLNSAAALQTRSARKYVVASDVAAAMIDALGASLVALDLDGSRSIGYDTVYFDTADLDLYLATARRRPKRFKVRTRRYADSGLTMLEVKTKNGRGSTVKFRTEHDEHGHLGEAGRSFVDTVLGDTVLGGTVLGGTVLGGTVLGGTVLGGTVLGGSVLEGGLRPTLTTVYERTTVADIDRGERITLDEHLRCSTPVGESVEMDGVIVESKSSGGAGTADRWLWKHGIRPIRFSKYCTGMAALDPSLPSNHWHRTLAIHFAA